jgi:hypothetical protein
MKNKFFSFQVKVWLWPGFSGWHFVYVDKKISDKVFALVKKKELLTTRNGLIPILAKVGKTQWQTSLLPHKKENIYLLAIKSKVRKSEKIFDGDMVKISFRFIY